MTKDTSTKLSRKRLSLAEKLKVVNYVKAGNTQGAAAIKFKVSRPAVFKMMKEEEQIAKMCSNSNSKAKIVKIKTKMELIEAILQSWHISIEINAPDINVTGKILKTNPLHGS